MRIEKLITYRKMLRSLIQTLSNNSFKKCMEISLENPYIAVFLPALEWNAPYTSAVRMANSQGS